MLTENLQIYRDAYTLASAILKNTSNVSKEIRYDSYAELRSLAFSALDIIREANVYKEQRYDILQRLVNTIGNILVRVRLFGEERSNGQRYVTVKFQDKIAHLCEKVEKQAIGWRNSAKRESVR